MDGNAIDWRALLATEIARNPRKKAGVAEELRVSRCYISRITSTGSSAITDVSPQFVTRVLDRYLGAVVCPATGQSQPRRECHKANQPAPTHNPNSMRIWRHCQQCALKPAKEVA